MKNKFIKKFIAFSLSILISASIISTNCIVAKAKPAPKKNICIVLDPGHDVAHFGCHFGDLHEETVNYAIALFCAQELQSYNGVDVYLTRNSEGCPYGNNPNDKSGCLAGRVNFAKKVKANAYVSIHCDYDGDNDPNVKGAKVIYQNRNYRKDLCLNSYTLASNILTELQTTGLTVNNWKLDPNGTGLVTRTSTNSKYPDGSLKDYYAVLNQTKSAGIPGVIIEHGYFSNADDRNNHFSTREQLKALGVADATAIAKQYNLQKKAF